jgi:membrane protease YdiL (CAAX protease family)
MAPSDDKDPSRPNAGAEDQLNTAANPGLAQYPPPSPGESPLRYPPPPGSGWRPSLGTPFRKGTSSGVLLADPSSAPTIRRDATTWIALAVVGFVAGQIVALLFIEIAAGVVGQSHHLSAIGNEAVPPEWYIVSSLVGLWSGFFGAPWLASRVAGTKRFALDLGLSFKWVDLWGILIGVGGQLLVAILYAPFIKHLHNFSAPTKKLTGGAHGGGFLLIAVATVLVAPFMEELFFRGLLFRGLLRLFSPSDGKSKAGVIAVVISVVIDGALFGLAHGELQQFAGLAVFGVILAYVSYRTARLGMNMVSHASFNLVAVLSILSQDHWHL